MSIDTTITSEHVRSFRLVGAVVPLLQMRKATGWQPTRPLGGWLMTYGKIADDGSIIPTVDREGQTVDAARELGHIDWSGYVGKGVWNDTHDEGCIVGLPTSLEFHDAHTELAKAHRKVGFWTTGHLFDRADPQSWEHLADAAGGSRRPTEHEFARADHFWRLGNLLKGVPRPLGFSAHGRMALSPCRKRIVYCEVDAAAVCETPQNPDSTAELLLKGSRMAVAGSPLEFLRKGMIGASLPAPCGKCSCAPGSCTGLLRKAAIAPPTVTPGNVEDLTPDDVEASNESSDEATAAAIRRAIEILTKTLFITPAQAARVLKMRLKQHRMRKEATYV